MKKAMISQPMGGLTGEEIANDRNRAIAFLEGQGYEVLNTLFTDDYYNVERKNKPLMFLAKSLDNMCDADVAYFVKGWEKARGCRIERMVAESYGIPIIDEGEECVKQYFN